MPNQPPIPLDLPNEAERVPEPVRGRLGQHDDDHLASTGATVDVDLRSPWPKVALALAAGYVLGFALHERR